MNEFPIQSSKQLSLQLRSLRKRLGLTQAELGERLGVAQARIGKIERNPGAVSVDQLLEIIRALDVSAVLKLKSPESGAPKKKVHW